MRAFAAGLLALSAASCAITVEDSGDSVAACPAGAAARAADEAMAADYAFAAMAKAASVPEAFAHYAAADTVTFRRGVEALGRDAMVANFAEWPAGARLEWAPARARGSACGDMAWTWGNSVYIAPDGTQHPGRYVTVWKRDESGAWRFEFDAGLRD